MVRKDQKKKFNFRLPSSTDQITKTVRQFDELLEHSNCCTSREKSELSTALSEALANAIIHGNRIQPNKTVFVSITIFLNRIEIMVRDEGEGFDPAKIESPLKPENLKKTNGRGIYLMRLFMDEVKYSRSKKGMKVTLIKNLRKK